MLKTVQQEHERLQKTHKKQESKTGFNTRETSAEVRKLQELTKKLEFDNKKLREEQDVLKVDDNRKRVHFNLDAQKLKDLQDHIQQSREREQALLEHNSYLETLVQSLQRSNSAPELRATQTILECKIKSLENDIDYYKRRSDDQNINDFSLQIRRCNEEVLNAKRDMNRLNFELNEKNTTIVNMHAKIECLENALKMSNQRMNAQLVEIEDLRSRNDDLLRKPASSITIINHARNGSDDELHQQRQQQQQRLSTTNGYCSDVLASNNNNNDYFSSDLNNGFRTSSPVKSPDIPKYVHNLKKEYAASINLYQRDYENRV
ncbi:unnamed protein product [Didymodactylos carnosus]|uniref:Uncharacterized protein n=1 Tax=Didymodactylos carnosus TaxID=1234261 RepID=A0A8S2EAI3_9BILA|nr:unnamed protein product [Didymodactylos carnosus]CAF3872248.1 unnamed protein product [Didymodactylos carnosus]